MEIKDIYEEYRKSKKEYEEKLKSRMEILLVEIGLNGKVECEKGIGFIQIEESTDGWFGCNYAFKKVKKDGSISLNNTYVNGLSYYKRCSDEEIKEYLKRTFKACD